MGLLSCKIVACEIHENESSDLAPRLIRKACLAESITGQIRVLRSGNGSPMKGASMLGTLRRMGLTPSLSRSQANNDNAYADSLFRTCKYRQDYPVKSFATIDDGRARVLSFGQW